MKKNTKTLLGLAAVGAGLYWLSRKKNDGAPAGLAGTLAQDCAAIEARRNAVTAQAQSLFQSMLAQNCGPNPATSTKPCRVLWAQYTAQQKAGRWLSEKFEFRGCRRSLCNQLWPEYVAATSEFNRVADAAQAAGCTNTIGGGRTLNRTDPRCATYLAQWDAAAQAQMAAQSRLSSAGCVA
jgi:hypothetical protein